ncbi:unnamed protein product [Mytilus edulis]|uniref:Uncharacterized protein n=1 Tax=Mytilus edulis TaxID=6550 RepID=A0A8S3RMQ7_MYTED|nr:unnamed protein product [Mytilus edulis]
MKTWKCSNQIGEYSYGQIRCIEDKSVNVQQIWFDNEGNCEYETSKRKEIFNEQLAITSDSNISHNNSSNHVITTATESIMRNTYGGRRKCMIKKNETNDSTHGQSVPDNNQEGQLMDSPDVVQVSASHAVNVYHTTESITYSHLRSSVKDDDVMYDHTVRHNVHNTCDGDYGIAHRRITEDDYDVSGTIAHLTAKR